MPPRRYVVRTLLGVLLGVPLFLFLWLEYQLYYSPPPQTPVSKEELEEVYAAYKDVQGKKVVAFTFDDGPRASHTPEILDILDEHNIPATFFLVGEHVLEFPDIAHDIAARGFTIAAHSHTHGYDVHESKAALTRELNAGRFAIEIATGFSPRIYRPPFQLDLPATVIDPSRNSPSPVAWMVEAGYVPVGADVDPYDWVVTSTEEMLTHVRLNLTKGNVLVFHDTEHTARALPAVLALLESEGYEVVPLEEVIGLPTSMVPVTPSILDTLSVYSFATLERVFFALISVAILLVVVRLLFVAVLLVWSFGRRVDHRRRTSRALVSVIIPAWNEEENIEATMRSVLRSRNVRAEIIVVDDGSTDRTYDIATRVAQSASHMRVTVLSKTNGGKASALNVGLKHARGVIIVCLDADTIFAPETIQHLVAPLRDPSVGAVSGKVTIAGAESLLARMQALEYLIGQNVQKRAFQMANAMSVIPGAVGAWRKRDVRLVGGVPSDTLVEDHDLTLAILSLGRRVVYEPRAVAYTEAPSTVDAFLKQRVRWVQGAMQCAAKYRKVLFAKGTPPGLRLVLINAYAYDFFLPFFYPVVDIMLVMALLTGTFSTMALPLLVYVCIDLVVVALATRGEKVRDPFLMVILMRLIYRHFLFLAYIKSLSRFVEGRSKGWQKLARAGDAQRMYFNGLNGELPVLRPTQVKTPL